MTERMKATRRGRDEGFTLIELLVVVVILGVLASVVVFSVRGLGDRGEVAAVEIDERTIRTAQEAFCAQENRYASGPELVSAGFLSDVPTLNVVTAEEDGGPCNGWSFTIGEPCDETLCPAGGMPHQVSVFEVALPDGRVLSFSQDSPISGLYGTLGDGSFQLFDPSNGGGIWTDLAPLGACGLSTASCSQFVLDEAVVLKGSPDVCSPNCGKVLVSFTNVDSGDQKQWGIFDPDAPSLVPTEPPPLVPAKGGATNLLYSPACEQGPVPSWCGKVLATGGNTDPSFGATPQPGEPQSAQLYDPKTNSWELTAPMAVGRSDHLTQTLADGRVVVMGGHFIDSATPGPTAEVYDPDEATWSATTGPPVVLRRERSAAPFGAALLPDKRVMFAGGSSSGPPEIFDPETGTFSTIPGCPECTGSTRLTSLPDGRVVAMLRKTSGPLAEKYPIRVFDPEDSSWVAGGFSPIGWGTTVISGPAQTCGSSCGKILLVSRHENGSVRPPPEQTQLYSPPPR